MKNGANAPGLLLLALAVVALVVGLGSFAAGNPAVAIPAAIVAVLVAAAGGAWVYLAHRRVRRAELRWAAEHPHADVQPPAS